MLTNIDKKIMETEAQIKKLQKELDELKKQKVSQEKKVEHLSGCDIVNMILEGIPVEFK